MRQNTETKWMVTKSPKDGSAPVIKMKGIGPFYEPGAVGGITKVPEILGRVVY